LAQVLGTENPFCHNPIQSAICRLTMFTTMAARSLVLVVAIAFSPSCCTASYDKNHDFGMVEGSHLSLIQTAAVQKRGTKAKAKQADPGRDSISTKTCMMMGDGGCSESWSSFADISSAPSISSMNAPADADASMGADDIATDFEKMPSSKSLSLGQIFNVLTFLVCLNMLRLWYVERSGDSSEDDGVSGPEALVGDAVEDNEDTPSMDPVTTSTSSSILHLAAGNAGVSAVETFLKQDAEVDERDAYGETPLHAPVREGALQSLIALVSSFEGDKAEALNANEDCSDDSEDFFENGWDGWTWKEAAETTVSVA